MINILEQSLSLYTKGKDMKQERVLGKNKQANKHSFPSLKNKFLRSIIIGTHRANLAISSIHPGNPCVMGKPGLHSPERGVPDTDRTNTQGLANHETIKNVFLNKYSLRMAEVCEKMFCFERSVLL